MAGSVGVQRGYEHGDVHAVGGAGGEHDVHGDDLGVKDTAGNTIAAPVTWSFTTAAAPPPDTTPPTVTGDHAGERRDGCGHVGGADGDVLGGGAGGARSGSRSRPVPRRSPAATAYNAGTNTATFTPSAALAAATTYTATVSGVKDTAGNTITAPFTWSFTTAATTTTVTLTDTTVADFTAGTGSGTAVVQTADGEVALAPAAGNEFSGTALPAGWTSTDVATGGTTAVGSRNAHAATATA